jgi:hypothetical protein
VAAAAAAEANSTSVVDAEADAGATAMAAPSDISLVFFRIPIKSTQICNNIMKSAGFTNFSGMFINLGPRHRARRCGTLSPKFWKGLPTPPKRPIRRPVGHIFKGAGEDALTSNRR